MNNMNGMARTAGRPRKNPGEDRRSFLWHPAKETAAKVERLCRECELSANAVITMLAEYGLEHVSLEPKTVQQVRFSDAEEG